MGKNKQNIAFIIIVAAMVMLPFLLTDTEEGAISDVDGRILTEWPLAIDEGYSLELESYFRDRLGAADMIKASYVTINDMLSDELINPTYQYGKDDWVFFKLHNNIEYSEYHKVFAEHVLKMQKYCEDRGSRFYYVFNPEKESVYREYLPAGVNYNDTWVDEMLNYMTKIGVNYIDLRHTLVEKKSKDAVFNKQYDAGHWNNNGAFYGMKELTERMHDDDAAISVLDEDEYNITTTIAEKLNESNQVINEVVPTYKLKCGYNEITGALGSEIKISESYSNIGIYTNDSKEASSVSKMLVLDDDLYTPFALSRAKETVEMSCLQNAVDLDYYYNIFKPEVVILETMEYVLNDGYFGVEEMGGKNWQPALIKNYPSETFDIRKKELLAGAEKTDIEVKLIIDPGKAIDNVYLSKLIDDGEAFYLLSDTGVTDLQMDSNGVASASVRHNEFKPGKSVTVYYVDKNGNGAYIDANIVSSRYMPTHTPAMYENILCFSDRPMLGDSDYANGVWRFASYGTGNREITEVDKPGFRKGLHITGAEANAGTTEVGIDSVPLEFGKAYVLSCYAKGYGQLYIEEGKTTWDGASYEVNDGWKQYSYSFIAGEKDGSTQKDPEVSVYFGANGGVDSDILICGMKLERSDNGEASEWTANPDDSKRERTLPH